MLRLGIIGSGSMARTRCANIAASPGAQLVAIASRNPVSGAALAVANDCAYDRDTEVLLGRPDIDAVLVCTHNASHGTLVRVAQSAGKHVLVEYPLALSAAEADAAVAMAQNRRLALRVGYDQQFLGPHAAIQAMVGKLGMPLAVTVQVTASAPAGSTFRALAIGGTPGQAKPYYLYALLDWLGVPVSSTNRILVPAEGPDGHYIGGAQMLELSYPGTLAHVAWVVGAGVQGRQQIGIELHWATHSLHSNGRKVTVSSAAGEEILPVQRLAWSEATRIGLGRFLTDCAAEPSPLDQADVAAATARMLDPDTSAGRG